MRLNKNFSYLLSRCLAQTFIRSTLLMDYPFFFSPAYLHLTECFVENLQPPTSTSALLQHPPQAGSLEPAPGTAVAFFLCSHVIRSPSSLCFILHINLQLVKNFSGTSSLTLLRLTFVKLPVYFCKTEKSCIRFTQTVYDTLTD